MNNSKNRIPLVDLEAQFKGFSREMEEAILRVVHSGRFIGGSEVEVFEAAFAQFCGTNYCIGVASQENRFTLQTVFGTAPNQPIMADGDKESSIRRIRDGEKGPSAKIRQFLTSGMGIG